MAERRNFSAAEWADIEAQLQVEVEAEMRTLSKRIARRLLERMRAEACGQHVYIPASPKYDEDAVLAAFNGRNGPDVCKAHGISMATLYRILKRRQQPA